jgi:hypothetical protein
LAQDEIEIIKKIRESKEPDLALKIATEIVIAYLIQKESSRSQSACLQPESCATNE